MDHYGIGQAIEGMIRVYLQSARGSGRTTSLVESVKNGDCVCFLSQGEADRVRGLCKERGVEIETVVVKPQDISRFPIYGTSQRLLFDHSWIEDFYLETIKRAQKQMRWFEREFSKYGVILRETQKEFERTYMGYWTETAKEKNNVDK